VQNKSEKKIIIDNSESSDANQGNSSKEKALSAYEPRSKKERKNLRMTTLNNMVQKNNDLSPLNFVRKDCHSPIS